MHFTDKDISIVIQGPLYAEYNIENHVRTMRDIFPKSEFILSSTDTYTNKLGLFDKVIKNNDIKPLPPLKFNQTAPNNINKQIHSTISGIKSASRPLVLKIRSDQFVNSSQILNLWNELKGKSRKNQYGKDRIITISLFSLNPRSFERLAYHVSDMLLFGYKEDIQRYFSCPYYQLENSIWYQSHKHADSSNKVEKAFRSRYAAEQWLLLNFLFSNQDFPIKYHNHISKEIIHTFEDILVDTFIIVHPRDIDLSMPKFSYPYNSKEYNLFCYSSSDSLRLLKQKRNIELSFNIIKDFPHSESVRKILLFLINYPYALKKVFKTRRFYTRIKEKFHIS